MDLSGMGWITELGIPGLLIVATVTLFFIFAKWILPNAKDMNLKLSESVKNNHAETMTKINNLECKVDIIMANDEQQEIRLNSIEITQSNLAIYNEALPYAERVWSAHRYIRLDGNGTVRNYINSEFRNIDPATFDSVWALADQAVEKVDRS